MLKGKAVQSFTLMFLQMWNIIEKDQSFAPYLEASQKIPDLALQEPGYIMPYGDCPLDLDKVGEQVYMDLLNRAEQYVHMMTPYPILDGELETALKYAAQRGVDVKLILPGIPDKPMAYSLAKTHYKSLLEAGVQIYEFTPGFVHAKVCIMDGKEAITGTINLDYRSLYHHFECAAWMYRTSCIPAMEEDFQKTLQECRKADIQTIWTGYEKLKPVGYLMKTIAPLI